MTTVDNSNWLVQNNNYVVSQFPRASKFIRDDHPYFFWLVLLIIIALIIALIVVCVKVGNIIQQIKQQNPTSIGAKLTNNQIILFGTSQQQSQYKLYGILTTIIAVLIVISFLLFSFCFFIKYPNLYFFSGIFNNISMFFN